MDIFCLWVGRLVLGGCALMLIPILYWWAFERLLNLVDPARDFWDFYFQRLRKRHEKREESTSISEPRGTQNVES